MKFTGIILLSFLFLNCKKVAIKTEKIQLISIKTI